MLDVFDLILIYVEYIQVILFDVDLFLKKVRLGLFALILYLIVHFMLFWLLGQIVDLQKLPGSGVSSLSDRTMQRHFAPAHR